MHHSKELALTFIMMLVFSCCTVTFNNYSTLYIIYLNLNLSSQASLKPHNKTALYFNFLFNYNVHSNVRMATGCVDSIFKTQCTIFITSMKLTTTSF